MNFLLKYALFTIYKLLFIKSKTFKFKLKQFALKRLILKIIQILFKALIVNLSWFSTDKYWKL